MCLSANTWKWLENFYSLNTFILGRTHTQVISAYKIGMSGSYEGMNFIWWTWKGLQLMLYC